MFVVFVFFKVMRNSCLNNGFAL